jgi:DNA-binding FadR family transcriptional regulator
VAAQAAERRTPDDVHRLHELLTSARTGVVAGHQQRAAFLEADKQIHMAIAETTRNPIYVSILSSIHDNIHRYYDRFLSMDDRELRENYRDLCNLVAAIEKGATGDARRLAREHVQRFNGYMQRREQQELVDAAADPGRQAAKPALREQRTR